MTATQSFLAGAVALVSLAACGAKSENSSADLATTVARQVDPSSPTTEVDPLSPVAVTGIRIGESTDLMERPAWWGPNGPIPELMPAWIAVVGPKNTVIGYVKNANEYWNLPPDQLATTTPPDLEVWDETGTQVIGCHLPDGSYTTYPNTDAEAVTCAF